MTAETNIHEFIEAQRRLFQIEMERFKNFDQLRGGDHIGHCVDVGEGLCREGASSGLVVRGVGLPQTIPACDNRLHIAAALNDDTIAAADAATKPPRLNDVYINEVQSKNKNDPLVETLPLSCDGRCLDKEKQAFLAETLVQSEKPLTFTRSNAIHTPTNTVPGVTPAAQSPPGLGSNSGNVRMLRRCAGEYSPNHPTAHAQHRTRLIAPYLGLGEYDQQKQRQDLNLNLNNVNKPKHNRHVHYNSNVIGGTNGIDATIYEHGVAETSTAAYKSNLNKRNERIKNSGKRVFIDSRVVEVGNNKSVQTDIKNIRNNLIQQNNSTYLEPISPTTAINNNPRGIITNKHSTTSNQRNINLNINNNFTDDQQQSAAFFTEEESSELELTDLDLDTANTNSDTSDNSKDRPSQHTVCACAPTDCVMHHNSRSPILHRLDCSSGVGTSSGSTVGTSSRFSHMDKPRSILSNRYYTSNISPRERLLSDLKHTYVPSVFDSFNFTDRTEEYERERVKKELYQNELRLQIEEKRRQATMRENQERVEQELENRRLEQQLLRMHEEELRDEERRTLRRNSEDLHRRAQEIGTRATYQRRHTDSESSLHKMPSPYSPPMARRNQHNIHNMPAPSSSVFDTSPVTNRYNAQALRNRMDSLSDSYGTYNTYGGGRSTVDGAGVFNRYDSLSRIDALKQQHTALSRLESLTLNDAYSNRIQRRHSATHQDLSASRRSPKLQRRSSSNRFDADALPIPLLKAASHSPVARDLRNATAVNSNKYSVSDSLRRLEEKWQIPAVQKNIMSYDVHPDGHNRSILTQLGSMRVQLQQEQLRMDEALRRRGYSSQYKAVNFH